MNSALPSGTHFREQYFTSLNSLTLSPSLFYFNITGSSVAEWLERAVVVLEVSGSSPSRVRQKNLCGRREPSDYISFRKAVKGQRFHALKQTIQRQVQHNNVPYKYFAVWNLISVRSQQLALIYYNLLQHLHA